MAKKAKPKPDEDEAQSKRFIETAKELEADGGLREADAEAAFNDFLRTAAPTKRGRS